MAATREKTRYRILLRWHGAFEFEVTAKSAAEACKMLGRKLQSGEISEANAVDRAYSFWADPADQGDSWLVKDINPNPNAPRTPIMEWNGKETFDSGLPLMRIDPAVRPKNETGRKHN